MIPLNLNFDNNGATENEQWLYKKVRAIGNNSSNSGVAIHTVTYAQFETLAGNNNLTVGDFYKITDATKSTNAVNVPNGIPLIVQATGVSTADFRAESPDYPRDVIMYNYDTDVITYRWDTYNNASQFCDWRNGLGVVIAGTFTNSHIAPNATGTVGNMYDTEVGEYVSLGNFFDTIGYSTFEAGAEFETDNNQAANCTIHNSIFREGCYVELNGSIYSPIYFSNCEIGFNSYFTTVYDSVYTDICNVNIGRSCNIYGFKPYPSSNYYSFKAGYAVTIQSDWNWENYYSGEVGHSSYVHIISGHDFKIGSSTYVNMTDNAIIYSTIGDNNEIDIGQMENSTIGNSNGFSIGYLGQSSIGNSNSLNSFFVGGQITNTTIGNQNTISSTNNQISGCYITKTNIGDSNTIYFNESGIAVTLLDSVFGDNNVVTPMWDSNFNYFRMRIGNNNTISGFGMEENNPADYGIFVAGSECYVGISGGGNNLAQNTLGNKVSVSCVGGISFNIIGDYSNITANDTITSNNLCQYTILTASETINNNTITANGCTLTAVQINSCVIMVSCTFDADGDNYDSVQILKAKPSPTLSYLSGINTFLAQNIKSYAATNGGSVYIQHTADVMILDNNVTGFEVILPNAAGGLVYSGKVVKIQSSGTITGLTISSDVTIYGTIPTSIDPDTPIAYQYYNSRWHPTT